MLDRRCGSARDAVADIEDGARVMVSGFGEAGRPNMLLAALIEKGVRNLEIISNNAGEGETGLAALFHAGMVRKLICSFPRGAMAAKVEGWVRSGALIVEVVPQGTLAERIRAAGAGVAAFYTPTGYGTGIAEGRETRMFDGRGHVLETALHADFSLLKARQGDRWGNLTYNKLARNFTPLMATAAKQTIVEVDEIVDLGTIDPERVVTPGIFVDKVVTSTDVPDTAWKAAA